MKHVFSDAFKLNLDVLKKGKTEELKFSVPCDFLDVHDAYLHFHGNVDVQGEAYIVDTRVVLHLDVVAHAIVPCIVCNGEADVEVCLHNFYHVEDISESRQPIYDFSTILREEILVECPQYSECHNGQCPDRNVVNQYLSQRDERDEYDTMSLPFSRLLK